MASEASFDLTLTKMKRLAIAVVVALMGVVAMPTSASAQFDLSKIFGGSSETTKTSPYKVLAEKFGFTADNVYNTAKTIA